MSLNLRLHPWLALLLFSAACRTPAPPVQPGLDPEEAARLVVNRLEGIYSFSAEIEITFTEKGGQRSASGAFVVARPDRIRLRCWGPLGVTVLDLLVINRNVTLYLPQEERALSAALPDASEWEDVPAEIRPLMLLNTLLDELETPDRDWRRDESSSEPALLLLGAGRPIARIVYDPGTLLPLLREDLVRGARITYEDYAERGGRWWPGLIKVVQDGITVQVEVNGLTANPEFNPAVFELGLPHGVRIERR